MINMILLVGIKTDIHLTRLQNELICRGVNVEILDPTENTQLHIERDLEKEGFRAKVKLASGDIINITERTLIWHRVKVLPVPEPQDNVQQVNYLRLTEKKAYWRNLNEISNVKFINSFEAIEYHRSKIHQLKIADQIGLSIPPTCISNFSEEIEEFRHKNGDCLIKPLMTPRVPGRGSTTPLSMHAIKVDAFEQVASTDFDTFPMIVQQYIEKKYELRVFVFGSRVKAFRVDSQNSKMGKVDWRLAQVEEIFEETDIPSNLENILVQYLTKSKLDTGSFDFIVDKNGNYVFLECNPSGQWGWLEKPVSDYLPITRAIADEIIGKYMKYEPPVDAAE